MDAVYMEAVQAITGSGGWPMSVFLTPDGRPFFGGTYFPPEDRHGMPVVPHGARRPHRRVGQPSRRGRGAGRSSWPQPSPRVRRIEPATRGPSLFAAIGRRERGPTDLLTPAVERAGPPLRSGVGRVRRRPQVPPAHAGGPGPLPRRGAAVPAPTARVRMATLTLDAMAAGGIHDHLGGGFARYSTDRQWLVPHFEKMLYDQAGLLRAYLHGWQVTGRGRLPAGGRRDRRVRRSRPDRARRRACTRPRTPTPRAWRGGSTSGPPTRSPPPSMPASTRGTVPPTRWPTPWRPGSA